MTSRRSGAGRPGSLDEARELVTLISSLSDAGDSLSADAVAERLGIDAEEAEKLVALVLSSAPEGDSGLPLIDDAGALTLADSGGVRGRRLRLTQGETLALLAALRRLGVDENDPIHRTLSSTLCESGLDEGLVRRVMAGERGTDEVAARLAACGRAMSARRALVFSYRKPGEAERTRRRALPLGLRANDGAWLLDAYDLDRGDERTFRLDRMDATEVGERVDPPAGPRPARIERLVHLTLDNPSCLDLLPWHDLRLIEAPADGPVFAETPYYGGMWLPRMIAACGGSAHCDDTEVMALAKSYARQQKRDGFK